MTAVPLRQKLVRLAAYGLALIVLLGVFGMYLRPDFMVALAQQVWACF